MPTFLRKGYFACLDRSKRAGPQGDGFLDGSSFDRAGKLWVKDIPCGRFAQIRSRTEFTRQVTWMTNLPSAGIQFAEQPRNMSTAHSQPMCFDMIREANGIEHRLTKPNQPWTNGQVSRMNPTIQGAMVKRCDYDSHNQLHAVHGSLQLHPASQHPLRPHTL
ncbi:hypothetical protein GCM10011415_36850 [Salipiger pallidus]|uniref:Integrase catalytic domain-containing protein n=1 Tax=Salipiger pallidus TaxID=1775170 RepID=A0A8J2ZMF9_9RHOB|nr:hypothetical protein GCM10011415_36850 [Salipiger pallidus]